MRTLVLRHRRILGEMAWVFVGQGASALATLVGLRIITEMVPPEVFGAVALALGVVALAHGLAAVPLMQAVLRFYPDLEREGRVQDLRRAALRALRKPVLLVGGLLTLGGIIWVVLCPQNVWLAAFALALFVAEVARSVEVTFLNAARRQRTMGLFIIADAWLRPISSVALIWLMGASSAAVMAGYLIGCLLALGGFRVLAPRPAATTLSHGSSRGRGEDSDVSALSFAADITPRLRAYALPLTLQPLIGWVSGQADRFLLAGMTGVEAAGLYAALYGLASKPFLMFSGSTELALRPPYYARVSAGDAAGERRAFVVWLSVVVAGSLGLCILYLFLHADIADVVLAPEYRAQSALMGWIAAGYVLLAAAQVFERVCYAHHDTRGVVGVQSVGAILSVLIAAPLIHYHGLAGAAWAVPLYFGAQLLIAAARARRAWRRGSQAAAAAKDTLITFRRSTG